MAGLLAGVSCNITSDQETHAQPKKSSRNVEECCCDSRADPHLTSFLTQPSPPAQGVLPPVVAWALLKPLAIRKYIDMLTDQSPPGDSSVETPYLGDFKLHQVSS